MTDIPLKPLALEQVKRHPLFHQLSEKQQTFTLKYIENPDGIRAVYEAGYNCKSDSSAETLARKWLKDVRIKQLVAMGLGYEDKGGILNRQEMMLIISDHIRRTENANTLCQLSAIFLALKGWAGAAEPPNFLKAIQEVEKRKTGLKQQ